jgi:hypothetical protein
MWITDLAGQIINVRSASSVADGIVRTISTARYLIYSMRPQIPQAAELGGIT